MKYFVFLFFQLFCAGVCAGQSRAVVFQSDFGLKDGAVAAMKGVAYSVSNDLHLFDLSHEIPAFNIWEGAYRLNQAAPYWPSGTVFVSVVDPGVGSDRKSIVMKTKSGHYFVTPDNGTLTLIAVSLGVEEVREIDEAINRLSNSQQSYTFHGRDVYAYTGARLAAGIISFQETGPLLNDEIVKLPYQQAVFENGKIRGTIDVLDSQYGNVWTNINRNLLEKINVNYGEQLHVRIFRNDKQLFEGEAVYGKTFADVPQGKNVVYMNSLNNVALAINRGNFAGKFKISSGPEWRIELSIP